MGRGGCRRVELLGAQQQCKQEPPVLTSACAKGQVQRRDKGSRDDGYSGITKQVWPGGGSCMAQHSTWCGAPSRYPAEACCSMTTRVASCIPKNSDMALQYNVQMWSEERHAGQATTSRGERAHSKAVSSAPRCTRTTWVSSYLARARSPRRLVSTMAAPPMRNSVLGMSMLRSLPRYQFCARAGSHTVSAMLS